MATKQEITAGELRATEDKGGSIRAGSIVAIKGVPYRVQEINPHSHRHDDRLDFVFRRLDASGGTLRMPDVSPKQRFTLIVEDEDEQGAA